MAVAGITILDEADARASTSNWIPPNQKWPYSINWNLGVQHTFGKDFTAEIAMWEPAASTWMFRTELTAGRW